MCLTSKFEVFLFSFSVLTQSAAAELVAGLNVLDQMGHTVYPVIQSSFSLNLSGPYT